MIFMEESTNIGYVLEMRLDEEMKALRQFLWMNLPNHFCDDEEERDEQVGNHLVANEEAIKISRRITAALRDLAMMEDIQTGSNVRSESDGRITFYPNTVKNGPM